MGTWRHVESRTWVVVQIARSGGRLKHGEHGAGLPWSDLQAVAVLGRVMGK